jgi:hypothetical protein
MFGTSKIESKCIRLEGDVARLEAELMGAKESLSKVQENAEIEKRRIRWSQEDKDAWKQRKQDEATAEVRALPLPLDIKNCPKCGSKKLSPCHVQPEAQGENAPWHKDGIHYGSFLAMLSYGDRGDGLMKEYVKWEYPEHILMQCDCGYSQKARCVDTEDANGEEE